jgi:hypothetical protein
MTAKKLFKVLLGALLAVVAGSILMVWQAKNWLTGRSAVIITSKLDVAELESTYNQGLRARTELLTYNTLLSSVDDILPEDKDQVNALSQIIKISDEVGITINTISFPSSELGSAKPVAPKAVETTNDKPSEAPAVATPTQAITQAKPVDGLPGIYALQVRLDGITQKGSVNGPTYDQVLSLLRAVERNQRTLQITSLGITPVKDSSGSTTYQVAITLNLFIKP